MRSILTDSAAARFLHGGQWIGSPLPRRSKPRPHIRQEAFLGTGAVRGGML